MRICDECPMLLIDTPVNKYDCWRACCCDPAKPVTGARRVVGTAPANSETGPVGIQTPVWCRRNPPKHAATSPLAGEAKSERRQK